VGLPRFTCPQTRGPITPLTTIRTRRKNLTLSLCQARKHGCRIPSRRRGQSRLNSSCTCNASPFVPRHNRYDPWQSTPARPAEPGSSPRRRLHHRNHEIGSSLNQALADILTPTSLQARRPSVKGSASFQGNDDIIAVVEWDSDISQVSPYPDIGHSSAQTRQLWRALYCWELNCVQPVVSHG